MTDNILKFPDLIKDWNTHTKQKKIAIIAWSVAVFIGLIFTIIVGYRQLFPAKEPLIKPKKSLLIILHENGSRNSRLLYNVGSIVLEDELKSQYQANIGLHGEILVDSVPEWLFMDNKPINLQLIGVDTSYKLIKTEWTFRPNDTFYIPYNYVVNHPDTTKKEISPNTIANEYNLIFVSKSNASIRPFKYSKSKKISKLKEYLVNELAKITIASNQNVFLTLDSEDVPMEKENLSLKDYGFSDNAEIGLRIVTNSIYIERDSTSIFIVISLPSIFNPKFKINSKSVNAEQNGNNYKIMFDSTGVVDFEIKAFPNKYTKRMHLKNGENKISLSTMQRSNIIFSGSN